MMRRWLILPLALLLTLLLAGIAPVIAPLIASAAAAEEIHDCDKPEIEGRIRACTALIETPDISEPRRATAYANRALSYSLRGQYEASIKDYDNAIALFPDFAVALNNRAWAYFKWGRASQGMADVQRSLQLDPFSAHSLDTRAHIHQSNGDKQLAQRDYEAAMVYGGARMVTLYQCGLKMNQLYTGPNDGVIRAELLSALRVCIEKGDGCDPLPPDEECREATS
jgi:tetratricopeptide (TPR) repeat protein